VGYPGCQISASPAVLLSGVGEAGRRWSEEGRAWGQLCGQPRRWITSASLSPAALAPMGGAADDPQILNPLVSIVMSCFGPGLAWVCVHRIPPQIRTSAPLPRGFFLTKTSSHALWGAATSCGRRAKLREGWLRSGIGIPSSSDQPALVLIIAGINSPN
jgi:hypothetical protein